MEIKEETQVHRKTKMEIQEKTQVQEKITKMEIKDK